MTFHLTVVKLTSNFPPPPLHRLRTCSSSTESASAFTIPARYARPKQRNAQTVSLISLRSA